MQDLRKAFDLLPPHQREAVALVGAAGMSYKEGGGEYDVCGRDHQKPSQLGPRETRGAYWGRWRSGLRIGCCNRIN